MARDGRGHQPDRAGADDEHVLAEDREGERGVDRVAERVEDRGDLLVDARPVVPDVGHRQDDVLGERPVAPDAEPDRVGAQVPAAGEAVAAAAADDVALAADEVAGREVGDVAADLDDLADELVADDERRLDRLLRPRIPGVDVQVRAADAGLVDADQDVVDAHRRLGHVAQLEARAGRGLDQGVHARSVPRCVVRGRAAPVGAVSRVGVDLRPVDDRVLDRADALDLAADPVAGLEEDRRVAEDADARRRAGRDDVAGLQGDRLR